jgi:hypothetical protein
MDAQLRIEALLSDWDNRPSPFWENDEAKRIRNEIKLLEALEKYGSQKTRDGLSIKQQLAERRPM